MDALELRSYFDGSKAFHVRYTHTFVDYDDIESPIKSFIRNRTPQVIRPEVSLSDKFMFKSHELSDVTQLF